MPHFRFRLPSFFSSDTPSHLTSGPASTPATPPSRPPRPPFRPGGIAHPPPKSLSAQTTSAVRSNSGRQPVLASSASSSPGVATSSQQAKQGRLTVLPLKRVEHEKSKNNDKSSENTVKGFDHEIMEIEQKLKGVVEAKEQEKNKEKGKLVMQETKTNIREGTDDVTHNRILRPAREHLETKSQGNPLDNERSNIHEVEDGVKQMKPERLLINSLVNPNEGSSMSTRIKEDIKNGINKLTWDKSNPDNDEKLVKVMTLTGENKGATMTIGSDKAKKDNLVHIHRGYINNIDKSPSTATTTDDDEDEEEEGKKIRTRQTPREEQPLAKTYVNSNSQSINNSIMYDSSVSENNPGAHVNVNAEKTMKARGSPKKKPETVVRPPPAEKKEASEPRVRRRCLRGLLAESSDSETQNPLKPRRHGCRFSCKGKDSGISLA